MSLVAEPATGRVWTRPDGTRPVEQRPYSGPVLEVSRVKARKEVTAEAAAPEGSISVLCVDDDPDFLEMLAALLAEKAEFDVQTTSSPMDVVGRVDDVDCVVSDYNMPERNGLELLSAVRAQHSTVPFVLCTGAATDDVADALMDRKWTELVHKEALGVTTTLLVKRIQRLVTHHRTKLLADRVVSALAEVHDGVAVVEPDGQFSVVNRAFARRFDSDPQTLRGRDWRTCFPSEEVERLKSNALEHVRDNWRWTGYCLGQRPDGDTFTVRTRLVGIEDTGFVVCLSDFGDS